MKSLRSIPISDRNFLSDSRDLITRYPSHKHDVYFFFFLRKEWWDVKSVQKFEQTFANFIVGKWRTFRPLESTCLTGVQY